jgi:uncharacterized protein YbjT (DUF2867 family)
MILVTGATGHVGGAVAKLLSERGQPVRLLVRDRSKAPKLGAEIAVGEYGDAASLAQAFDGVETAFIVSAHAPPGERAVLHAQAFAAAERARVKHVLYLSLQGSSPTSRYPYSRDHFASEAALRATGLPHTIMRSGKYTEQLLEPELIDREGVIRGPVGEGLIAWFSRADAARVVATLLTGAPAGIVEPTGPEALTLRETAARLSQLSDRPIRCEDVPVSRVRERVLKLPASSATVSTPRSATLHAGSAAPRRWKTRSLPAR